jgi:hypothetical protein
MGIYKYGLHEDL